MKMSEMYPDTSTWLKAADLQKRRVLVEIDHVRAEEINSNDGGKETKAVVYFKGHEKGLVLNKTNAAQIAYMYGDEMDMWTDRRIELYPTMVDFAGKMVEAIRIAPPPGQPVNAGAQAQAAGHNAAQGFAPPQPAAPTPTQVVLDDELPPF